MASLESERPEESNLGLIKGRSKIQVRYSRATRCRYKKQLQRERETTKVQTAPLEAAFNPRAERSGASAAVPKRA